MDTSEATMSKPVTGAHAAVDSAAGAAEDVVNKAKPAIDRFAAMAHEAVDKAAAVAAPAAAWVSTQGHDFAELEKKFVDDTCKYVSANPLKSVAIALAAGFLLSRIIRS